MPQLFPGQGVLEGVMAGRQAEANLADIQAQSRLRQIQAIAANAELQKEQKKMQTIQGLYSGELKTPGVENFSAEPMDRQMEILSRYMMPLDPDTGLKAYDRSVIAKKDRMAQEAGIQRQKALSNLFAGKSESEIINSPDWGPKMAQALSMHSAYFGDDEAAKRYSDMAKDMAETGLKMQEAAPHLANLNADTRLKDAQADAALAKMQGGGMEPDKKLDFTFKANDDLSKATAPIVDVLDKLQKTRTLLKSTSKVAPAQIQLALSDLLNSTRMTNVIYKDSRNYGELDERLANTATLFLSGDLTLENKKEAAKLVDDMENNLIRPKLDYYIDSAKSQASKMGLDPDLVGRRELLDYSKYKTTAGEEKPTEAKPKEPTKSERHKGNYSPSQEDWISRMLADPSNKARGATREDVIAFGKKKGKL